MTEKGGLLQFKLIRNFSIVGAWTLASRILGFVRDMLIANFLGSGPVAEAFMIAFSLPNMFRRLFAEGAFNTAFIPMLSKRISNRRMAEVFASDALSFLVASILLTTAVAEIFMPFFVLSIASGFSEDNRFNIAVNFSRVMFPYIFLISFSAFLGGILNTLNKFSITAAAPLFLNIFFILALLIAHFFELDYGWAITIAVPIAGVCQLLFIWKYLIKENFQLKLKFPSINPEIRSLIKIAVPAALAGGVIQINLVVGRQVASHFDGAIAWLNYADRLYQLPLGVVGISIGIVLLPNLSKLTSQKEKNKRLNTINRSTEIALALTLPATCALLVMPFPLIVVLFERGAFSASDSLYTSRALFVYAIGLPAFVLQKIFSTIYFANGDTKSPFRFAIIGMLTNLILAIGLAVPFGYLASAIATSTSGWVITILLWSRLKLFDVKFDSDFKKNFCKILVATLGLGIFLGLSVNLLPNYLLATPTKYIIMALIVISGTILYFIFFVALGLFKNLSK
jgi:putative peptidoglycan lipid II flippase